MGGLDMYGAHPGSGCNVPVAISPYDFTFTPHQGSAGHFFTNKKYVFTIITIKNMFRKYLCGFRILRRFKKQEIYPDTFAPTVNPTAQQLNKLQIC